MKATESRSRTSTAGKRGDETDGSSIRLDTSISSKLHRVGLPRAASWAHKGSTSATTSHASSVSHSPLTTPTRQTRRGGGGTRQPRSVVTSQSDSRTTRTHQDRKSGQANSSTKASSQASSSRPPTPASALLPQRPATPADVKALRQKKELQSSPPPCRSPTSSIAVESDLGSGSQDVAPTSPAIRPRSSASILSVPSMPPGLPAVPPGLSAPPGIPAPGTRPVRAETTSPQMPPTPLLASQSSYQMSTAARALLDDVKARWETTSTAASPFPDLDRTLETLSARDGQFSGFSFNLDPKLAGDDADNAAALLDFEVEANTPFHGSYLDAFPGLKTPGPSTSFMAPPGLSFPPSPSRAIFDPLSVRSLSIAPLEKQSTEAPTYTGTFNPFADNTDDSTHSPLHKTQPSLDDDCCRKVSRFGFAQGRKGSTAASSPLHAPSPLSNSDSQTSFYTSGEFPPTPVQPPWMPPTRQQHSEYGFPPPSSPLAHTIPSSYSQHHSRFQPFESGVSEAQLRDLIQSSRIHSGASGMNFLYV